MVGVQECVACLLRLHGDSIDAALHDSESPFLPVNEKYEGEEWFSSPLVVP